MRRTSGVTLIELVVTLVVMGFLVGLAGGLVGDVRPSPSLGGEEEARRRAVIEPVEGPVITDSASVVFLPDGRAVGAGVDPLTGERASPERSR